MPKFVYPQRLLQFQLLFSLAVPCFVSLFPILSGARVSVLKALTHTGMGESRFGVSLFDRFISLFRGLPRPVLVSLRNTFRKKTRLCLTLLALSLGSAVFIAVTSLQTTLINTLDQALQYYNFDVMVSFSQQYRVEKIQATAHEIPGVSDCETWGMVDSHLVGSDGSESESIMLVAPPSDTQMINPTLIQGRWLVPEDENAVVINNDVVRENPGLQVGSEITLKIDGNKVHWIIVGIVKSVMIGPWAYTNYPYFANRLNRAGNAGAVYIQTRGLQESNQAEMVKQLADHFKKEGMHVSSISLVSELRNTATSQFNVIIIFLMIFAVLIALIGGLGVMGTMSLNVIERSREIGIMRAIGARNMVVLQIVMFEGAVIGIISWAAGCLLAYPIGNLLSELIGNSFLQTSMEFVFSREGAIFWLGCVLLLSMIASFFPAFNATRIPIREVLSYE